MDSRRLLTTLMTCFLLVPVNMQAVKAEEPRPGTDAAIAVDYSKDAGERIEAIQRIARSSEVGQFRSLLGILLDKAEEQGVRASAARALAELRNDAPQTIKAFSEVFREPGAGDNLRYTILMGAGNLRDPLCLPLLIEALGDNNNMVRFKAVQALGELGAREAVPVIVNHLAMEKDKMVRAQAARALGKYDEERSQGCLAGLLKADPEALVRLNAALSLKGFQTLKPEAVEALEAAKGDPSNTVRDAAKGVPQ